MLLRNRVLPDALTPQERLIIGGLIGGLGGALGGAIYEGIRLKNAHNELADMYNHSMEYMIAEMNNRGIPLDEFDMIALKDFQPKKTRWW